MKNLLLLGLFITSFNTLFSQTTLFEDSFETYSDFTITNFGNWVMYDVDQSQTWGVPECNFINEGYTGSAIIFNPSQCTDDQMGAFNPSAGNYSTLTGDKYVSFWCASSTTNDNYLVSPQIDLTNVTSPTLSLYAKALANANNGLEPERFEILVSSTGNGISDLTTQVGAVVEISDCCQWNEYTYDLSNFEGNQVYIAIHHISTQNAYALHIDDFKVVGTPTSGVADFNRTTFTSYPNPVEDEIHIKSENSIEQLSVYNNIGQKMININPSSKNFSLNVSALKPGVYFVKLISKLNSNSYKIVKK